MVRLLPNKKICTVLSQQKYWPGDLNTLPRLLTFWSDSTHRFHLSRRFPAATCMSQVSSDAFWKAKINGLPENSACGDLVNPAKEELLEMT